MLEITRNKRFEDICLEEYDSLDGSIAQRAYANICAVDQFDIPLIEELLVPTLECSWEEFLTEVNKGAAELTIIETGDESSGFFYESRHPLISKVVADAIFPSPESLTETIDHLIASAYPHDPRQEFIILSLLRNDELMNKLGAFENRRNVFRSAVSRFPRNDTVFLHYGILLAQEGEYDEAEEILRKGLAIREDNVAIVHYLGIVYRNKARFETKRGELLRNRLFQNAAQQFVLAIRMDPFDEHGYHSHAEMLLDMKRHELTDQDEKDQLLSQALDITSTGLRLVPRPKQKLLRDLHFSILAEYGQIEEGRQHFEQRTESGAGPDTWALWARIEWEADELERAKDVCRGALTKWPENQRLILIAADVDEAIMNTRGRIDPEGLTHLERAANIRSERSDIRLRYAVALFLDSQNSDSEEEFRRAYNIRPDSVSPTFPSHHWTDESGNRRCFQGTAVQQGDRWTARAPNLPPIYLNPRFVEIRGIRPGSQINFEIAFNYFGPLAFIQP